MQELKSQHEEGLAAAVREIQQKAQEATAPAVVELAVEDRNGGKRTIPVVFLRDADGAQRTDLLVEESAKAFEFVERLRLAKADGPDNRTGTARLQSLTSFIDHTNRFKDIDSVVWADAANRRLVSVLDYHRTGHAGAPRWGRHRGLYECPLSEAWKAWGGGAELKIDQDAFAALLDARDRELAVGGKGSPFPDPATLLSIAAKLEVYSHANAKRERDPGAGRVKVSFSEDKGVVGDVPVPSAFLISVPVFEDAPAQLLEVRLRVTVDDGAAWFHFRIHAAGDVLRRSFDELCDRVAQETGAPVFVGTPEA